MTRSKPCCWPSRAARGWPGWPPCPPSGSAAGLTGTGRCWPCPGLRCAPGCACRARPGWKTRATRTSATRATASGRACCQRSTLRSRSSATPSRAVPGMPRRPVSCSMTWPGWTWLRWEARPASWRCSHSARRARPMCCAIGCPRRTRPRRRARSSMLCGCRSLPAPRAATVSTSRWGAALLSVRGRCCVGTIPEFWPQHAREPAAPQNSVHPAPRTTASSPSYPMPLIVHKYGGTSMGSPERIRNVAKRVAKWARAGHQMVVVPSAMSGETNRLLALAKELAPSRVSPAYNRELDMLAATGEQASSALLAIALQAEGMESVSYAGWQVPIRTDSSYTKARIESIDDQRVRADLNAGKVVIVTGFQGIDEQGHITTLGRGGSDTSAVAVAAAMKADECLIYTDVDGVYTTDPRVAPAARRLTTV